MKRHFILGIMAVAALASCTKNEIIQGEESLKNEAISFSTYVGKSVQTKATTIQTDNVANAGIGILAWRTGSDDISETILNDVAPKFMQNIKLTWSKLQDSENYVGSYEPERYWPSNGEKVSFFAYAPQTSGDAEFHPENIALDATAGGAHKLTLTVPKNADDANTGVEYANHTDFMVARKGNGDMVNDVYTGVAGDVTVGINQNLNKNHKAPVQLQMKHALSKISFVAKATEGEKAQNEPYSNGMVKVVFDNIKVNGSFANAGTYDLFNETWTIDANANHEVYNLINAEGTENDPFNPIADELYNIQAGENPADETNTPDENGWYKLNKSSHDMMVIPFVNNGNDGVANGTISSISGKYIVKTYESVVNQETGETEIVEIEDYRDEVDFNVKTNINLEAGKAYVFQFNIMLRKIEFSVVVEDWDVQAGTVIVDSNN